MYQYYIRIDHIGDYSESDNSGVDRSSHEYTKAARKCETSLHITPDSLYNLLNINSNRPNIYARSKMSKEFGDREAGVFMCMNSIMDMECVL